MHTSHELTDASFSILIDDRPAGVDELFPGFDAHDRIGVVVAEPHGAVGASLIYLAAVHAFYELQRRTGEEFWIYPDFFFFHLGRSHGHHGILDVWPPHKEVIVEPEPDRVLEAINDRAVTRLIVPDGAPSRRPTQREALASCASRLRAAFVYTASGRTRDADIAILGDDVALGYVRDVLEPHQLAERMGTMPEADAVRAHLDDVPQAVRDEISRARSSLVVDGRPMETYRRLAPDDALDLLVPSRPPALSAR